MTGSQFIIFKLGDEEYGAHIHNIYEIILPQQPVKVPNNPDFIEGVIDFRGDVVPLLDLKKRFNLGKSDYGKGTKIIIAELDDIFISFIVDEVTEILRVGEEDIHEAPDITKINKEYISGVVRKDGRLTILLDLSKILSAAEQDMLQDSVESL